jgi:hypothetical protein
MCRQVKTAFDKIMAVRMTRLYTQGAVFAIFAGGLWWSLRDVAAPVPYLILVSLSGAVVYMALVTLLVKTVHWSERADSVLERTLALAAFIATAILNIVVWAILRFALGRL